MSFPVVETESGPTGRTGLQVRGATGVLGLARSSRLGAAQVDTRGRGPGSGRATSSSADAQGLRQNVSRRRRRLGPPSWCDASVLLVANSRVIHVPSRDDGSVARGEGME